MTQQTQQPLREPPPESPWVERPVIEFDASAPADRRFENVPQEGIDAVRRLFDETRSQIPAKAKPLADLVRLLTGGRWQEEAKTMAAHIGISWRDVMLANISYDLAISQFGCSTIALATPDGPVLARNMDWPPEDLVAQASFAIFYQHNGDGGHINLGWPGAIGVVTGMSRTVDRGFALALNAVVSPERVSRTGYPVMLHLRRVLEDAESFDEALKLLCETRLAASSLITLVGTENDQRAVIERSPTRHAVRRAEGDRPLVTTNDYRKLFKTETHEGSELYETTCMRHDRLRALFAEHDASQPVEDAHLLYALTDSGVMQGITAQHAIMRPRQREARLFVPRRLLDN